MDMRVVVFLAFSLALNVVLAEEEEKCIRDATTVKLDINCPQAGVIFIQSVTAGRVNVCGQGPADLCGERDAHAEIARECHGKVSCSVDVEVPIDSCPSESRLYLNPRWNCIKEDDIQAMSVCESDDNREDNGYLTSPQYPGTTNQSVEGCKKSFRAPTTKERSLTRVVIDLIDLELTDCPKSSRLSFKVDGNYADKCSKPRGRILQYTGRNISVEFHSNEIDKNLFLFKYTASAVDPQDFEGPNIAPRSSFNNGILTIVLLASMVFSHLWT